MIFEHLIRINDPQVVGLEPLSRQQLWMGLVARAWHPTRFVLGLESAEILSEQQHPLGTVIERKLNFGNFTVQDEVELQTHERTVFKVKPNALMGAATLTIAIEEPEPEALFLRFRYEVSEGPESHGSDGVSAAQLQEARKQAYLAADIDTVKMIREIARATPTDDLSQPIQPPAAGLH